MKSDKCYILVPLYSLRSCVLASMCLCFAFHSALLHPWVLTDTLPSPSAAWAASHSFSLSRVNLKPLLHQLISLWSWAQGEPRDYQRASSAVVPITAFCHSPFMKIKGFFFPLFASPAFDSLQLPASIGPRCWVIWRIVKRGILSAPGGALGHDLRESRPQIRVRSCISGARKVREPPSKPAEFIAMTWSQDATFHVCFIRRIYS